MLQEFLDCHYCPRQFSQKDQLSVWMKCHLGLKVSIKEHGDYKRYLRNISNLIINVSESNLPSMRDCLCGNKSGQKLRTCSEVLLSFLDNFLLKYSQSKYIKNLSFSQSLFLQDTSVWLSFSQKPESQRYTFGDFLDDCCNHVYWIV